MITSITASSFEGQWFINLKVPRQLLWSCQLPTTRKKCRFCHTGNDRNTAVPQPEISGNSELKLWHADRYCKKINFLPFSGAVFGAIFPAAAFFPSTCTEGTSVPVEEVGWSFGWIAFLPGSVASLRIKWGSSATVWNEVVSVETRRGVQGKFSMFLQHYNTTLKCRLLHQ